MKKYLVLIILMIPFFVSAQKGKNASAYNTIKSLYIDLNNDGKNDTINLSDNGSEGSFNRISIKLAGFPKQTFKAKEYWSDFDSLFLVKHKNLVYSNLLFVKKTEKHTVILLWGGLDGAGYGIEFSIINIENNYAKMVFDHHTEQDLDVEVPEDLTDLQKDGRLDFIFCGIGEEEDVSDKGKGETYTPSFVYPVDDSCKLNKPLMKAYNERHYIFAGYHYREDIEVYYPANGRHPFIKRRKKK